jgi:hypothetical protein
MLNQAISQDKKVLNNEISIKFQRNSFLDLYNTYFERGNGIQLLYSRIIPEFDELGDKGNLKWGINLGYSRADRKQDFFTYEELGYTSSSGNSYITFSDLQILNIMALIQINFALASQLEGYAALEGGYYGVLYAYDDIDGSLSLSGISDVPRGAIAPKIGVAYNLTDNFAVSADFTYNLHATLIEEGSPVITVLTPSRTLNHFYTLALGATFRF